MSVPWTGCVKLGQPVPEFAPVTSAFWPLRTLLIGIAGITASGNRRITTLRIGQKRIGGPRVALLPNNSEQNGFV